MLIQMWEGIPLQITEPMVTLFPNYSYACFPDNCCGAGKGFWEKIVPDYIHINSFLVPGEGPEDIKISPACWIHDTDWDLAAPTWDDFHAGNSRLFANIKAIVEKRTIDGTPIQYYALRFPAIYAHAVDTAGRKVFWRIKQGQGHSIPDSAAWLLK